VELAELLLQRTHYAREALCAIDGVEPLHSQPVIREFAVTVPRPVEEVVERCAERGVNPGLALVEENALLVAITEGRSRADIDRLAEVLAEAVAA
jgi:glycine dehydrogenase subunit 1